MISDPECVAWGIFHDVNRINYFTSVFDVLNKMAILYLLVAH